jgi:hypothetical protein
MLLSLDYKRYGPDTVALNLTPGQNPNSFYPLKYNDAKLLKETLVNDKNYKLTKFADELYLFTKIKLINQ